MDSLLDTRKQAHDKTVELPLDLRSVDTVDTFKKQLKTHLFRLAFVYFFYFLFKSVFITFYVCMYVYALFPLWEAL